MTLSECMGEQMEDKTESTAELMDQDILALVGTDRGISNHRYETKNSRSTTYAAIKFFKTM